MSTCPTDLSRTPTTTRRSVPTRDTRIDSAHVPDLPNEQKVLSASTSTWENANFERTGTYEMPSKIPDCYQPASGDPWHPLESNGATDPQGSTRTEDATDVASSSFLIFFIVITHHYKVWAQHTKLSLWLFQLFTSFLFILLFSKREIFCTFHCMKNLHKTPHFARGCNGRQNLKKFWKKLQSQPKQVKCHKAINGQLRTLQHQSVWAQ